MNGISLWTHFSFWYRRSPFLAPFLICYLTSIITQIFIPISKFISLEFGISLGIMLVNLYTLDKLTKQRVVKAQEEFMKDPKYRRLKQMVTDLRNGEGLKEDKEEVEPPKEEKKSD